MAQYQIGNQVYDIPDNTPQATVDKILDELALEVSQQGNNQQQGTDGVFDFAADQFQKLGGKGIEAFGRATGLEGVEKYGTDVVKQQEIDIAKGGYKSKYNKSFSDTWDEDGLEAAFGWIGEKVAENSMTTGASLVGAGATAAAALISAPAALLFGGVTLAGSALLGTGEVASEIEDKTGSYDPNLAVGVGAIIGLLDKFGAGKVIPKDQLAKLSAKQIAQRLNKAGFKEASKEFTKRTLKKSGIEFGTEGVQESLSMGASALSGGEYTLKEARDRFIDAGVVGGAMGGGVSVGTDAVTGGVNTVRKVKDGVTFIFETKSDKPSDPDGATELATMLNEIAEDNSFDLQDLDKMSQNGARVTVDTAHKQINGYMKQRIKDLKAQLQIQDIDEFELVEDKILANVGFEEARNKTKNIVGVKEFKSVNKLVGKLREGQELLKYMRMSNELSKLHNSGYQQGLSRITDNFSPIGGGIGYDKGAINTEKVLRPLASGGAAITTGGASLLGQLGIVAGGRAIDKLRGVNKSVVDQYIQDNKDGNGIKTIKDPSIRQQAIDKDKQAEQEAILAEQQKLQEQENLQNLRMQLDDENAPPTPNSPQFVVEDATGLTKQQVEEVLQLIEQIPNLNPALQKSINDYRTSVRTGGQVSNINEFIRAVNSAIDANGITRTNPQNQSMMQQNQQMGGRPSYQNSPNYQRGIDDNRAFADELIEAVNNDTTINAVDKALVIPALLSMKKNLGSNPIESGTKIIEDLAARINNPEAIQKYIVPYLNRVTQQQRQTAIPENEQTDDMAVPDIGSGINVFPKTKKLYMNIDGVEVDQGNYVDTTNGQDITGNTYAGARVYIDENGRGKLEVDPNQSPTPNKLTGKRFNSNLYRKSLWDWTTEPEGGSNANFLVTVEDSKGHYYAMQYEADVPVELYRKPKGDEPTMRPRGFGKIVKGNVIGYMKTKAGKVTHPVYDTIRIEPDEQFQTDGYIELRDPDIKPPKRNLTEIGQELEAFQNEKYGRKLDVVNNEDDFQIVKNQMRDEAKYQLDKDPNDAQWYDNDITEAINTTSEAMPEIMENTDNKDLLLLLTAVSSIGEKPILNWRQGGALAMHYFRTGEIGEAIQIGNETRLVNPSTGKILGFKGKSKEPALRIIGHMINTMGLKETMAWLHSKKTKREIDAMRAKVGLGGQNKILGGLDVVVPGIMIFGQKVAPFYLNLQGIKDVTVDLWASRGVRRITGGLINPLFGKSKNATALIDSPTAAELPTFKRLFTEVGNELGISPQAAQALLWKYEQELYNDLGGSFIHEKFSQGAKAFTEKDTVVYEGRHGRSPTRNARGSQNEGEQFETNFQDGGILSNRSPQGSGRDTTTTDSQNLKNPSRIFPTNTEINSYLPTIKKVLEVGKKGSPQETGLTREEILSVANALGYAMVFVKNKAEMAKRKGSSSQSGITHGYHRSGGSRSRENQPIEIVAIQQGYKNPKRPSQNVTELDELWTLAHEVAHGLSQSTNQRGVLNAEGFPFNIYSPDTSRERAAFLGTLEDDLGKVLKNLTEGSQGKKISQEIINLQLNAEFMSMKENALGNTKGTVTPRGYINDAYAYYESGMEKLETQYNLSSDPLRQRMIKKQMQIAEDKMDKWVKKNQSYIFALEELIADAVGGYLMSPQQFKSIAPNTAKFIRDNLNNKPSSKFVKFYASPLGTILAVIMSAFAMDDQEEEMPEGALQLGQGVLSA
jgi:hypothetical protein